MLDALFLPRHRIVVPGVESSEIEESLPGLSVECLMSPDVGQLVEDGLLRSDQEAVPIEATDVDAGGGARTEIADIAFTSCPVVVERQ